MDVLVRNKVLTITKGRKLTQFKNFHANPLHGLDWEKLLLWIDEKKKQTLTYKYGIGEGELSSNATDVEESTDEST